jgi:hypothetical protein
MDFKKALIGQVMIRQKSTLFPRPIPNQTRIWNRAASSLSERRKKTPNAGLDCQIQAKTRLKLAGNCQIWRGRANGKT